MRSLVPAAVGQLQFLPPVSLAELNAEAALQTRVDRKYIVPLELAGQLLASAGTEMRVLDMEGARSFAYDSVYFDTPELDSYLLAAHGRRRRYKIRTRTYVDSAASFLEVKTEGSREATVKERIPYLPGDRSRLTPEGMAYVRGTLTASGTAVPERPLDPVLETRYRRTTLYLPDSGSRATIDTDVTWQRPGHRPWILHGAVILETKSGSTAGPLDRHLWAAGVRPTRISKFATGMAALRPGLPANRWHRTLLRMALQPAPHAA
ncbi:polyphosphate polymerase domain-containing protein [Arthrobacter sp. NQ7]|uniref:polyphosphate polymerase domain-containing protein n=1 Tax=Arthrobacter sp. NQ7 TaxID=3032303 RepID=UPI00240F4E9A|nr:polyphosphate polymerase domain-containing protein [Arthrobacter sp. NQ7]MDJ0459511.1 polyphosphate polymerase domain-containing protein [Arthrobacter sp. NQ7]